MPRLGVFVVLIVCALACAVDSRRLMVQRGYYDEPLFRASYREPSVYLRRSTFGLGRSSNSLRPRRIQSGRILDLGFPETRQRISLPSLFNDRNGQLARTSSREVLGNSPRTPQHHQSARLLQGLRRVQEPRRNMASVLDTLRQRQAIPSSREVLGSSVFGHSQRALQPNHRERQLTRMIQVQEPRKVIAKVSISRKAASGKSSKEVIGQAVPVFAEQPAQSADMGKIIDIIQEQRKQQNKLLEQKQKQLQKQQELVHKSLQKQQEELQKMLQKNLEQRQKQQQQQVKLTSKEVMGLW